MVSNKVIYNALNKDNHKRINIDDVVAMVSMYRLVSFDIFDTMIFRKVKKPTDIFNMVEEAIGQKGFANARIQAERKARTVHSASEEITFNQIYEEIDDDYVGIWEEELKAEEKYTYANECIKKIYEYAYANNNVAICSDMYLPKDYLAHLLEKKGYVGIEKLYVSAEHMRTKATGRLFKYMISDNKLKADEILHIGDNLQSDGKAADLGMDFIHFIDGQMFYVKRKQ